MATAKKPAAKKTAKTHAFITVDKNSYTREVSALANSGATIIAVTVNQNLMNSFDVHFFNEK